MAVTVERLDNYVIPAWEAHLDYPETDRDRYRFAIVVDPANGEPVKAVERIEWDDEHKALVFVLGG